MSFTLSKRKSARLLASAAVLPMIMAAAATAQDTTEVEEIIVSGFRGSLNSSLASRRESTQLKDEIFAEDIGKFPDANLAEAMQRVPGVAIRRDVGEGNRIELRGLGSSFTNVLIHGLAVSTPISGSRSTNMSLFPSALFTKVSIEKSSRASQVEGGVAGTVDMRNARPFDFKEDLTIAAGATVGYNDHAAKLSPKGHLIASKTFEASGGRFGILGGASWSKRNVRFDGMESQDWVSAASGGFRGFDMTDGNQSGMQSSTWDTIYNDPFNQMPDPANPGEFLDPEGSIPDDRKSGALEQVMFPRLYRTDLMVGTRTQFGAVGALAWEPSETLSLNFDWLHSSYKKRDNRYNIDSELRSKTIIPIDIVPDANGYLGTGAWQHQTGGASKGGRRSENRQDYDNQVLNQFVGEVNWDIADNFTMKAVGGITKAKYEDREWTHLLSGLGYNADPNAPGDITYFDSTEFGAANESKITSNLDLLDPANYAYSLIRNSPDDNFEDNSSLHIDFTYGDEDNNIKFGIAYDKLKRRSHSWSYNKTPDSAEFAGLWKTGIAPTSAEVASPVPVDNFGNGLTLAEGTMTDWLVTDFDKILSLLNDETGEELLMYGKNDPALDRFPVISEENFGFYAEVNGVGEFMGSGVRYNAGFRGVQTQAHTDNFTSGGVPILVDRKYWDYMPSFNIAWDATDDVVVRMAGARTMTRPGFGQLDARTSVGGDFNVTIDNAYLNPYFSNQVDMTAEWYFAEDSVIALNLFYKEITGFIEPVTFEAPFSQAGLDISRLDANIFAALGYDTEVTFKTQANSDEERVIKGFEIAFQMPFDDILPIPGFGMVANYTYAAPSAVTYDTAAGPFLSSVVGQSKHLYNIVGYYENNDWAFRASYNYRSSYAANSCCRANQPRTRIRHGAGQLDTSASYNINDNFTINVDAINLNNAQEYTTYGEDLFFVRYNTGRQFFLSARAKF